MEAYFRQNLDEEMNRYLEKYNVNKKQRSLNIGDRVYIRHVPKPNEPKKLARKWSGPVVVKEVLSASKYKVQSFRPYKEYVSHIDNLLSRSTILAENVETGSLEEE